MGKVLGSVSLGSGTCHFWLQSQEAWLAWHGLAPRVVQLSSDPVLLPHSLKTHLLCDSPAFLARIVKRAMDYTSEH